MRDEDRGSSPDSRPSICCPALSPSWQHPRLLRLLPLPKRASPPLHPRRSSLSTGTRRPRPSPGKSSPALPRSMRWWTRTGCAAWSGFLRRFFGAASSPRKTPPRRATRWWRLDLPAPRKKRTNRPTAPCRAAGRQAPRRRPLAVLMSRVAGGCLGATSHTRSDKWGACSPVSAPRKPAALVCRFREALRHARAYAPRGDGLLRAISPPGLPPLRPWSAPSVKNHRTPPPPPRNRFRCESGRLRP